MHEQRAEDFSRRYHLFVGLVGIFLGPVVLAVVYTLLRAWVSAEPQ